MRLASRFFHLVAGIVCLISGESYARNNRPSPGQWPLAQPIPHISALDDSLVGGKPSLNHLVVAIHMYRPSGERPFVCSGVLIAADIVLTAGHCVCSMTRFYVTNEPINQTESANWFEAEKLLEFENYCTREPNGNDLALLRISPRDTRFQGFKDKESNVVEPNPQFRSYIPYSSVWMRGRGRSMRVEGYGFNGTDPKSIGVRRQAEIGVDSFICTEPWIRWSTCSPFYEFVMGVAPSQGKPIDSCGGDSGGPVFAQDANKKEYLVGIVSRGVPLAQPFVAGDCGAGGIYTFLGRESVLTWLGKGIEASIPLAKRAEFLAQRRRTLPAPSVEVEENQELAINKPDSGATTTADVSISNCDQQPNSDACAGSSLDMF